MVVVLFDEEHEILVGGNGWKSREINMLDLLQTVCIGSFQHEKQHVQLLEMVDPSLGEDLLDFHLTHGLAMSATS